jgi:hypothetical protein
MTVRLPAITATGVLLRTRSSARGMRPIATGSANESATGATE